MALFPVSVVALEDQFGVDHVLYELERPRADGIQLELFLSHPRYRRGRDDVVGARRDEHGDDDRARRGETEHHRVIIGGGDPVRSERRPPLLGVAYLELLRWCPPRP